MIAAYHILRSETTSPTTSSAPTTTPPCRPRTSHQTTTRATWPGRATPSRYERQRPRAPSQP